MCIIQNLPWIDYINIKEKESHFHPYTTKPLSESPELRFVQLPFVLVHKSLTSPDYFP